MVIDTVLFASLLFVSWILVVGTPSAYAVWQDSRDNANQASLARWFYIGAAWFLIPPWGAYPYFWKYGSEPAISERTTWPILGGAFGAALLSILIVELVLPINVHPVPVAFLGFIGVGLLLSILLQSDDWPFNRND